MISSGKKAKTIPTKSQIQESVGILFKARLRTARNGRKTGNIRSHRFHSNIHLTIFDIKSILMLALRR